MRRNNISNTYFLSKSLTERMLMNTALAHDGKLCIVRPSIVGAVAHQPCPGYVGNSSGFTALVLGAASGELVCCTHACMSASQVLHTLPACVGKDAEHLSCKPGVQVSFSSRHTSLNP